MESSQKPILFHYSRSIYSHRVLWYLWLRGIEYDECIQPPYMPRPDLAALSINYRRIPIMAIGKDVYCDSRLIIEALEKLYPNSNLTPSSSANAGIGKLFESWCIDGGIFMNSIKVIPASKALLQDTKYLDDRQSLLGGKRISVEERAEGRPDGLAHLRQAFEMLESTFLADGRSWILGTERPSRADIDGVWPFEWIIAEPHMKNSLPEEFISERKFPLVYAWVKRFVDTVNAEKHKRPEPTTFDGPATKEQIMKPGAPIGTNIVDDDPLCLSHGDEVEVYPSDYGASHKTRGRLVGLTTSEVVICNDIGLHVHFPRWNYHIEKLKPTIASPLPKAFSVPQMRLIYHPQSSYTRKVFMLAIELGLEQAIALEKVVVCPIPFPGWSDNNADVAVFNPMAKIPCLVPEDVPDGIFDSRIICDYLEGLRSISPQKDKQYWQLHTLHACADGIMDAGILIIYERQIREKKGIKFDEWIEGQELKMTRALDRLETAASSGILPAPPDGPASADEVAVVCGVKFAERMGILSRDRRPKLSEWFSKWERRRSFQLTPPTQDWKGSNSVASTLKI
ncbi:hypothetical protein EJ04DRAFT_21777 [Polyplosphaeria fusca]|uniref:GST N-terminal domain-containing protein n=1 Tax=Polyplosphaeria fusca TaxID=682080 RepID=A0A9P4QTF2_9PLEO|nr:hypothetical protein EJ04DRAFT_21777 [Polyplosphaeria fusca]